MRDIPGSNVRQTALTHARRPERERESSRIVGTVGIDRNRLESAGIDRNRPETSESSEIDRNRAETWLIDSSECAVRSFRNQNSTSVRMLLVVY